MGFIRRAVNTVVEEFAGQLAAQERLDQLKDRASNVKRIQREQAKNTARK